MKIIFYKYILLFSLVSVFIFSSNAQNKFVTIQGDVALDTMVNRNIEWNKTANGIPGFRIQIFFGSERKAAHDAKEKFQQKHPGFDAYLIYQQPYFKVRVGDFRTKLEAQPLLKKVLPEFDRVFIVPDKINLPKL
ncbi:MAG: SPOR domain-containing protein [Bacteroidia bacterium]